VKLKYFLMSLILIVAGTSVEPSSGQEISPAESRGLHVPENLDAIVIQQHQANSIADLLLQAQPIPRAPKPDCSASMSSFDWRKFGKVSPVQNQVPCGACWAFSAVAALESSFAIETGTQAHGSEQETLDCASPTYSCGGGFHDKAFDYLVDAGVARREDYIYTAKKGDCRAGVTRQYGAINWGFVEGANIPSNTSLKNALCTYGPIATAISSRGWAAKLADGITYSYSTKNPDFYSAYPKGVFKGFLSKQGLTMGTLSLGDLEPSAFRLTHNLRR
jgi:hypothetical protein